MSKIAVFRDAICWSVAVRAWASSLHGSYGHVHTPTISSPRRVSIFSIALSRSVSTDTSQLSCRKSKWVKACSRPCPRLLPMSWARTGARLLSKQRRRTRFTQTCYWLKNGSEHRVVPKWRRAGPPRFAIMRRCCVMPVQQRAHCSVWQRRGDGMPTGKPVTQQQGSSCAVMTGCDLATSPPKLPFSKCLRKSHGGLIATIDCRGIRCPGWTCRPRSMARSITPLISGCPTWFTPRLRRGRWAIPD